MMLTKIADQTRLRSGEVIDSCARGGMSASAGARYASMLWTRDLAIISPVYVAHGYREELREALRLLLSEQSVDVQPIDNGYEKELCAFGNVPIVCVPATPEATIGFLKQRLIGTRTDPFWARQLCAYLSAHEPNFEWSRFPLPNCLGIDASNAGSHEQCLCAMDAISAIEVTTPQLCEKLKAWYAELNKLANQFSNAPRSSFALKCYMDGTLANLTAGTRDSEIHVIRTLHHVLEAYKGEPEEDVIWHELVLPLARALVYLFSQVIDPSDGLPRGFDSRDIFSDLGWDAKLLSNACFLYEALGYLEGWCGQTRKYVPLCFAWDKCLAQVAFSLHVPSQVSVIRARLRETITHTFFNEADVSPRDFVPGARTKLSFIAPVKESPSNRLIPLFEPDFAKGTVVDPQGIAHAMLQNLVPHTWHSRVLAALRRHDSAIGITVFVPISGKTAEETQLLERLRGRVVWPHVSWLVIRALRHFARIASCNDAQTLADEQSRKLLSTICLPENESGCAEWYGYDAESCTIYAGGDPQQAWSAAGLLADA